MIFFQKGLSLIIKARAGGASYFYSLLMGYKDPPEDEELSNGYYNVAYPGNVIAMPQPLYGDDVEYSDGSPTTPAGLASDLTHFLMWAAEPKMEIRKRIGVAAVFFLSIFVVFSYIAKRRIWADLH